LEEKVYAVEPKMAAVEEAPFTVKSKSAAWEEKLSAVEPKISPVEETPFTVKSKIAVLEEKPSAVEQKMSAVEETLKLYNIRLESNTFEFRQGWK
jgi:hypothetical protein